MNNKNIRWIFIAIVVVIFIAMQNTLPKEALAEDGDTCADDDDCTCQWASNQSSYGLGKGSCEEGKCDMTYCINVQPVGTWLSEHPWAWLKENILLTALIIGLILMAIFWPSR